MFFGGKDSITPLHFDIDCPSNFLTQFHTRKKVLLFDKDQSKYLYHQPFTVQSQVDLHNPDYERFPALRKAEGIEAILEHGDTIYIPPHWWHYIEYVDSGFSLALRAHNSIANKFVAVRNLVQHSVIDKGMNKKDLHESIGIAPATIAKMGRGEFVSMEVLYRIATSLNADFGDLVAVNRKDEENK